MAFPLTIYSQTFSGHVFHMAAMRQMGKNRNENKINFKISGVHSYAGYKLIIGYS